MDDYSCGHNAFCYRKNPKAEYGICTPYLGLKIGEQANHSWGNGIWSREAGFRFCESFYADADGICRQPFLSISIGSECASNNDCFTSQNENHYCKCTLSIDGKQVCDAGPGDDVWLDAKKAFLEYMEISAYCHPAQGLGECQQSAKYKNW